MPLLLINQILDFSKVLGGNLDFNRHDTDCVKLSLLVFARLYPETSLHSQPQKNELGGA